MDVSQEKATVISEEGETLNEIINERLPKMQTEFEDDKKLKRGPSG